MTPQALSFNAPGDAEELARAELYGLLARLWWAPPDEALMAQFRVAVTQAPQPGGFLEHPWERLVAAGRASTVDSASAAFEALFGGVGKPEVLLYGSHHLAGFLNEQPLADLRADLARLGLARDPQRGETEDHLSFVFEVMRYLIAGDDVAVCNLTQQQAFFRRHVQTWVERCGEAVASHPLAQDSAGFYAALAALTTAFMQVETQAFDLID
ncbi:TorD/DmsD family molecular chaperone [Ideonella livida]|uniref:Molecular chaperone n=1 Tax=Ideonella livida TaxID=2707176 RepID=A0A7C9TKL4_9BURK|nr:molecular chaperone TorD family protein [Ideonella livida]NDY91844.1 molecular chaperone [Ideonella livida]